MDTRDILTHDSAFNNLWTLFLSTNRAYVNPDGDKDQYKLRLRGVSPFKFAGGLAFPPPTIGFAMAILGFIGVALQFLLYPWANGKFGLMRCFRSSLFFFPLAYFLAPYISLLPSATNYPDPASGFWIWAGIALVLTLQVTARTFALPASVSLALTGQSLDTMLTIGADHLAKQFIPASLGPSYDTWPRSS